MATPLLPSTSAKILETAGSDDGNPRSKACWHSILRNAVQNDNEPVLFRFPIPKPVEEAKADKRSTAKHLLRSFLMAFLGLHVINYLILPQRANDVSYGLANLFSTPPPAPSMVEWLNMYQSWQVGPLETADYAMTPLIMRTYYRATTSDAWQVQPLLLSDNPYLQDVVGDAALIFFIGVLYGGIFYLVSSAATGAYISLTRTTLTIRPAFALRTSTRYSRAEIRDAVLLHKDLLALTALDPGLCAQIRGPKAGSRKPGDGLVLKTVMAGNYQLQERVVDSHMRVPEEVVLVRFVDGREPLRVCVQGLDPRVTLAVLQAGLEGRKVDLTSEIRRFVPSFEGTLYAQ
ncbi:hypothetical protein HDU89_008644 [Geranomyces variabilis]|nr:hypothetical protein HDU89_008644 [Geranomyces variabilis]